jgi:hypothetical protein
VIERAGDRYTLAATLTDGVAEEAVIAAGEPALVRLTRRGSDGRVLMVARFDRIREAGGLRVATRIEVRSPESGDRLRIDWAELEPNPDLRPADIAWPPTSGSAAPASGSAPWGPGSAPSGLSSPPSGLSSAPWGPGSAPSASGSTLGLELGTARSRVAELGDLILMRSLELLPI